MRVLVFDTNAFVQDLGLEGHAFQLLLLHLNVVTDLVAFPIVVLQETSNKYEEFLRKVVSDAKKASERFERLTGTALEPPDPRIVVESISQYRAKLMSKFGGLAEAFPYPSIDHESVVQRAILRRRPFQDSGAGYRDTIIWESILEIADKPDIDSIIFITNNSKDFLAEDRLAPDLIEDLRERGHPDSLIRTYGTVKALVDAEILPSIEQFSEVATLIEERNIPGIDFDAWLQDALFDCVPAADAARAIAGIAPGDADTELSEIYEIKEFKVEHGYPLPNDEHYLIVSVFAGVGVNVCASWVQYGDSLAVTELFDCEGTGQPAPYACVYAGEVIWITLSLVVHSLVPFTWSVEIISVESTGSESET
tara:strand:+ start:31 stop:1128 length:1098 start_codon:yes stop_codon:yes gene_type:complete